MSNLTPEGLPDFPVLLDTREAAKRLSVSKSFLEQARCKGDGPVFVRLSGGLIRYRESDLLAFVEANLRTSTSDGAGDQPPQVVLRGRFGR